MATLNALLVNDASLSGHHGSAVVTSRIVDLAREAGIAVCAGWTWNAVERDICADAIPFDLIIVNGEGSIHHDSRAARRIAAVARRCRELGTPAYLINASEEANSPGLLGDLTAFRMCFVRDTASQRRLARAGAAVRVVADLTLTQRWPPGGDAHGRILVTDASDTGKTDRLLKRARHWPQAKVMTFRAPPPLPVCGSAMRRISFEVKRLAALFAPATPWSIRYGGAIRSRDGVARIMAGASGILCARYHAVCFALAARLPFLAVEGNIGKIAALLADCGLPERQIALDDLHEGRPPAIPPFSASELARIDDFISRTMADARLMFASISSDARAYIAATLRGDGEAGLVTPLAVGLHALDGGNVAGRRGQVEQRTRNLAEQH